MFYPKYVSRKVQNVVKYFEKNVVMCLMCRNGSFTSGKSFVKHGSWQSQRETSNVAELELIGYFSLDGRRTYLSDSTNLSYYVYPKGQEINFDLNQGIQSAIRKSPSADEEKIDNLLKWIQLNHNKIQASSASKQWIEPNFVCFRGLLTVLLCTSYQPRDGWIICAAKWKGTIYLCAFKTPEEKEKSANMPKDQLKFMSWGLKFEKYILSDAPDKAPDVSQPVNEAEEFCCMFRRRFGDHTILFGAEMDGVTAEKALKDPLPLQELKFVELKTSKVIECNTGQERNFYKFKLLKWWSQSFLVGIEQILCGFRDDSGIVRNLKTYSLPEIVHMSRPYWNPRSCIKFCQSFLTHMSKTVVNDCDKTIYKFERIPFGDIVTKELSPTSEFSFMSPSYMEKCG